MNKLPVYNCRKIKFNPFDSLSKSETLANGLNRLCVIWHLAGMCRADLTVHSGLFPRQTSQVPLLPPTPLVAFKVSSRDYLEFV